MRVAIDTNVLAYAEGINGTIMRDRAIAVIHPLPEEAVVIPLQVLGELYNVLVRKGKRKPARAAAAILAWRDAYETADTSATVLTDAAELASTHKLSIWDSVILSAAAQAGCRMLLSEDLQAGFTWRGVTVVNPFSSPRHPLLAAALSL